MKKILFLLLLSSNLVTAKLPVDNGFLVLPQLNIQAELNKDIANNNKATPLRYATATEVDNVFIKNNQSRGGLWNRLANGSWVWRLKIMTENALSLDVHLDDFFLPPTAELRIYDWAEVLVKGPFLDQQNNADKQFWPGPVIGHEITLELIVSDKYKSHVSFSINEIFRGFKRIWQEVDVISKRGQLPFWDNTQNPNTDNSGSCNVDVSCDDADNWQDQVNSVARYTYYKENSMFTCTGQLLNNTKNDKRPLFLSAYHCGVSENSSTNYWQSIAPSINIWWNYQSNQCRTPNTQTSSSPIPIENFNDTQSGATVLAQYEPSDMVLLELNRIPDESYEVYFTGWDRSDKASDSGVVIHHPSFHAKRISFENNPLSITDYLGDTSGDRTHLRVNDWDKGTTEGGSSGAGLWSNEKLLIGQLHGGYAACGNDDPDWFGRLFTSWNGGGSPATRLKDYLDPTNSNQEKLQGLSGNQCQSLTASISHQFDNNQIGIEQIFSVSIAGGTAPYNYEWDINNDTIVDGNEFEISVKYASKFSNNIQLKITDSEGCIKELTKAVVIESPQISIKAVANPIQLCGNGDNYVDPGERWQVPVTLHNNGSAVAQGSYAVLNKLLTPLFDVISEDSYGNSMGFCEQSFIDISSTGTELTLVDANPNDGFSANDEGSAKINITHPFNFYGQTISNLSFSTNGYISIDSNDDGSDFDNDCPLPSVPNSSDNGSSVLARIIPLHDDLITQNIYYQYFDVCPRQEQQFSSSCYVFMYQDVDLYNPNNSIIEHFDFEAILYPETSQWVFQYNGIDFNASSASIGIQNSRATAGMGVSCNNMSGINTEQAICIKTKNTQTHFKKPDDYVFIETSTFSLGTMQVSQQKTKLLEYSISEEAQCGDPINIQLEAAVYSKGFNKVGDSIVSTVIGNSGNCHVSSNCGASSDNTISPTNGLWHNPQRSGNGLDMYFLEANNTVNKLVYLQYTAEEDRSPIWYITGTDNLMQNNQSTNELLKISYAGEFLTSTRSDASVGMSTTTLIDPLHAIQTRTINNHFSVELLEPLNYGGAPLEQRTGLWFNPTEAGWGFSIGTQGNNEVALSYLYDRLGQPYWILGAKNIISDNIELSYFKTFCPHCPKITIQQEVVGSVQIKYDPSNTTGKINSLEVDFTNNKRASQWSRHNYPIQIITPALD